MSAETFSERLELERLFNAPIERVFDAWTKAEVLSQWFGPGGFEVIEAEIDCRPNGQYSITLLSPEKQTIKHFGEYLEVTRPHKLIFTWYLEDQSCQGSKGHTAMTLVEIDFIQQGEQTLLQLRHEKLPDQTALDGHRFGWESSFVCLDGLLNR